MGFYVDEQLKAGIAQVFGEYLITFKSTQQQVRADLFKNGRLLEAHVSFMNGVDAANVTDKYVSALWQYAREQGYGQDRVKIILS